MAEAALQEEEDLEELEVEDSAETIFRLRTNEKRKHTRVVNKIKTHMENHGSKRELRILRNQLAEALDDCTTQHNRYMNRLGLTESTSPATTKLRSWLLELDKITNFWFEAIEDHLKLRKEDERSASSSSGSQPTISPAAAKLLETIKARREAETKLQQAHRENFLRESEEDLLASLQHQTQTLKRQIEFDRKERQLADALERHSLNENFERATSQLQSSHSLPDTFEEKDAVDIFAPFTPTALKERPTANSNEPIAKSTTNNNEESHDSNQIYVIFKHVEEKTAEEDLKQKQLSENNILSEDALPTNKTTVDQQIVYLPSENPADTPLTLDEVAQQYLANLPEKLRSEPAIQRFASRISAVFPPDSPFHKPLWGQKALTSSSNPADISASHNKVLHTWTPSTNTSGQKEIAEANDNHERPSSSQPTQTTIPNNATESFDLMYPIHNIIASRYKM